jgi:hypothetical protein
MDNKTLVKTASKEIQSMIIFVGVMVLLKFLISKTCYLPSACWGKIISATQLKRSIDNNRFFIVRSIVESRDLYIKQTGYRATFVVYKKIK